MLFRSYHTAEHRTFGVPLIRPARKKTSAASRKLVIAVMVWSVISSQRVGHQASAMNMNIPKEKNAGTLSAWIGGSIRALP